jgi:hypothetical protein
MDSHVEIGQLLVEVFAYCTLPAAVAVARATGVKPFTSPPLEAADLGSYDLEGYDLLYFRLHGLPSLPDMWLGERGDGGFCPAVERRHIREADLTGSVVVLANCYGATSPMAQECYRSGAAAVVAGYGPNYAAKKRIIGGDLLVKWLIFGLRHNLKIERALRLAKRRLLLTAYRMADRDARKFQIIDRRKS